MTSLAWGQIREQQQHPRTPCGETDYTVRYCGSVGYLGLCTVGGVEIYRTGKHYRDASECFSALYAWVKLNATS